MSDKLISIVMPMHNAERFIRETIESILNQTYKNFELIIVDDCSTDSSLEIVKEYANNDNRIVILKNERNLLVSMTRNNGVAVAKGEMVALIDSDDKWEPNFLESVKKRQSETGARLVNASYKFIDNEGNLLMKEFVVKEKTTYKDMLKQNTISCSAVFVEKELLLKYPFYADEVHEDYLCWLSIMKEIKEAYGVLDTVSIYRLTTGSKSRNKFKAIKMSYFTYRKHGCNVIKSLFYTFCNALNGLKKYSGVKKKR